MKREKAAFCLICRVELFFFKKVASSIKLFVNIFCLYEYFLFKRSVY